MKFLPPAVRNRMLRRGLSFKPDAAVANGDHVYWDLLAPKAGPRLGGSKAALEYARFDRAAPILGGANESALLRVAGEQISPLYGTLCRSTPVYFLQDDHDHFDNDVKSWRFHQDPLDMRRPIQEVLKDAAETPSSLN